MRLRSVLLCAGLLAPGGGWAATVALRPGDDIQAALQAHPPGTTFLLRAGVHRLQAITPRSGDVFLGEPGAVLNGARLLTEFRVEGNYWVAEGQTQQGRRLGSCQPGRPRCHYPEDLFLDDRPLLHVSSLEQVAPGRWYFDYQQHRIYFADDPAGRRVEAGVAPYAFAGETSRGVVVRGLILEKYANPAGEGVIRRGPSWRVEDNEIRWNHGLGIWASPGMQIRRNRVHHNGQLGVGGSGEDVLVEGNEIAYNNWAGYDWGWEAGGTKFVWTTRLVARANYVHDNQGPGLWLDINNYDWLVEGNRTQRNLDAGLLIEISYRGVARFNVVESDGLFGPGRPPSQNGIWYRAGIVVANSPDVELYGNTVVKCLNGIAATSRNRGSGNRGIYVVRNLHVHDNVVTQYRGTAAGLVANESHWNAGILENNRFAANHYKLPGGLAHRYFVWRNEMSQAQWQERGHDRSGVWWPPAERSFPSTRFREGHKVRASVTAELWSTPSWTYGMLVGTLAPGARGVISTLQGPIYSHQVWWWHVVFLDGAEGWVEESRLADAGSS